MIRIINKIAHAFLTVAEYRANAIEGFPRSSENINPEAISEMPSGKIDKNKTLNIFDSNILLRSILLKIKPADTPVK